MRSRFHLGEGLGTKSLLRGLGRPKASLFTDSMVRQGSMTSSITTLEVLHPPTRGRRYKANWPSGARWSSCPIITNNDDATPCSGHCGVSCSGSFPSPSTDGAEALVASEIQPALLHLSMMSLTLAETADAKSDTNQAFNDIPASEAAEHG